MKSCFTENSTVAISWFQGSGKDFVEASSHMKAKAPHKLNNTLVWLNSDKAVAVTMASILSRKEIDGKSYDLTSFVRFLFKCVKEDREWKIFHFTSVYEKDCLVPSTPSEMSENPTFRKSYSNLANVLSAEGYSISQDLPGEDVPETVENLIVDAREWLKI